MSRRTNNEPDPLPLMFMSDTISGKAPVRLIVPLIATLIESEPLPLPAAHSPGTDPEATLLFAAVIASRKVQKPSLLFATSRRLLTVIVACGVIGPLSGDHRLEKTSRLVPVADLTIARWLTTHKETRTSVTEIEVIESTRMCERRSDSIF